jgi:tetratricopeptide (TPR) repeat protein
MNLSRPQDAAAVLHAISSARSKPVEYSVNLSWALQQVGRAADAEHVAKEGLARFPADTGLLGNLSLALCWQDKYEEAKPLAELSLKLSRDVHSLEQVALIEMSLGDQKKHADWPTAIEHYIGALGLLREAKERNPRYLPPRFNLARTLMRLDHQTSAIEELDSIDRLGLDQGWAGLWAWTKAQCLQNRGSFHDCWKFCDIWLQKYPTDLNLRRTRAEALAECCVGIFIQGRKAIEPSCLEFFETIIQDSKSRTSTDFLYLARISNWASDNPELAYVLLDEAEKLEPRSWEIFFYRGDFLQRSGEHRSALAHLQQACVVAPWRSDCWSLLAFVQLSLGLCAEAARSERRATLVSEAHERLARGAVQAAGER